MRHQTFDVLVSVVDKGTNKWREEDYQKNNSKIFPGAEETFRAIISTGPLNATGWMNELSPTTLRVFMKIKNINENRWS